MPFNARFLKVFPVQCPTILYSCPYSMSAIYSFPTLLFFRSRVISTLVMCESFNVIIYKLCMCDVLCVQYIVYTCFYCDFFFGKNPLRKLLLIRVNHMPVLCLFNLSRAKPERSSSSSLMYVEMPPIAPTALPPTRDVACNRSGSGALRSSYSNT